MSVTEMSIMHHVCIVLFSLWLLSYFDKCHPVAFFVSFIYLFLVHERYVMRLQKKLQFAERKQANQKRVLTDSETVRWLNDAMEKIWPICMENIASQKILLPIIPWFLEKYKPWTAKKALVQHMYLGRNPPLITEMRVLRQSSGDDHLVLELGMNFLTADDMSAILAVKLRKRLGFGMWAKLHITGMHVEGKVLVGVKFLRDWPYLGRLRVCFAEPPYFQMTVKPIFTHGVDVTELPGIAGWLDKLLSLAFEQTLVQPNMLVVNMEKFVSPKGESWFSVDEKQPVAYAKVEVVEASDMKPSDLNGLADPYVKGQLGPYKFRTKIQKKTLSPKWNEEFKIPIISWDFDNKLIIGVRDKDHFVDDTLGDCAVNVIELRDGERHDMWVPLENIKMGRLHLAITILEENVKEVDDMLDGETLQKGDVQDSFAGDTDNRASFSSVSSVKSPRVADNYEPINIKGQEATGVWVHQPGSEVSQTWEPRKGKSRNIDTEVPGVPTSPVGGWRSAGSGPPNNDSGSSGSEDTAEVKQRNRVQRGLQKLGSVFHRNSKKEDSLSSVGETVQSPYANIRSLNEKEIGVKFIVEDCEVRPSPGKGSTRSLYETGEESPGKGNVKGMAKSILKHAEKSARNIKHVLSRKGSRKSLADSSVATDCDTFPESGSSNDESLSAPQVQETQTVSSPKSPINVNDDPDKTEAVARSVSNNPPMDVEGHMEEGNAAGSEKMRDVKVTSLDESGRGPDKSLKPLVPQENLEEQEKVVN